MKETGVDNLSSLGVKPVFSYLDQSLLKIVTNKELKEKPKEKLSWRIEVIN